MTVTSTPEDGLPVAELVRRRREEQAAIQEKVMLASLRRQERLALGFARRLKGELVSIFAATEKDLSAMASRMKEDLDREQEETRRRIRHPWLPLILGAALVLAIQATVHCGPELARWLQERRILGLAGAEVLTREDGRRWIRFPRGTNYALEEGADALFIRIPEG